MSRLLLLAVGIVALGACDSSVPGADDPIVGTWSLVASTREERVTVNTTQTVLDASGSITNDLTISGSESGRVPFGAGISRYGSGRSFTLASFDPERGPLTNPTYVVYVNDYSNYAEVRLDVQGPDNDTYRASSNTPADLFIRSGWTYQFDALLQAYDGSERTVQVTGGVTLPTRQLTAGESSVLSEYSDQTPLSYRLLYRFHADGRLVVQERNGNQTLERVGTWIREEDRVYLRRPAFNVEATEMLEYAVEIRDGRLILTNDLLWSDCNAYCLQSIEQNYGLETGSVLSYTSVQTARFEPSTAPPLAAAQAADAGTTPPLPRELRDWLVLDPSR